MTAAARWLGRTQRPSDSRSQGPSLRYLTVLAAALVAGPAPPALAQVAASVGVESDYRFRGYSLSAERPVATANLAYDGSTGAYLNASGVAVFEHDGPALMSVQGNIGYAKRLRPGLSIDGGILRSEYLSSFSGGRSAHYTEAYLGLATRRLSTRVFFSPDYFRADVSTLYWEVEGVIEPAAKWRLNGHVGLLSYLKRPSADGESQFDWRIGASRQLGNFEVHVALSGRGDSEDYYDGRDGRTAFVIGAACAF